MSGLNKFKKAILKTTEEVVWKTGEFLQTFLTEEKRDFPNVTIRQFGVGLTGKIAGSPRDVVDSGQLRDSFNQRSIYEGGSLRVVTKWEAPHAEIVYSGVKNIPPYPWVTIGLREINWTELFKEEWRKYDN